MARRNVRGIMFALEDMETNEVVDNGGELEGAVGEINEDGNEIQNDVNAVSDNMDDVGNLEEITDVMQDSVDNGEGLDPTAAKIADVAIEGICARLGFAQPKTICSLEAFGSKHSRVAATTIALEMNKEAINTVWQNFKKRVVEFFQKLFDFWKKLSAGAVMLKKNLQSFHDTVDKSNIKKDVNTKGTFQDAGLAKAFSFGGRGGVGFAAVKFILAGSANALTAGQKFAQMDLESGLQADDIGNLTNGTVLVDGATFVSEKASGPNGSAYANIDWVKSDNKPSTDNCPVLDKTQMLTVLKSAMDVADGIEVFIKQERAMRERQKELLEEVDKALSEEASGSEKDAAKKRKDAIKAGFKAYSAILFEIPRYSALGAKATLEYCKKSFKAHSVEKAD